MASQVSIPFPLSSAPGAKPHESAGRLINCYAEPLGETAGSQVTIRRSPGLASFGTSSQSGYRGSIVINGVLYSAFSGKLVKHTSSGGAATVVGNLNGTKRGFFAHNNKSPTPDQVFVDPDGNIATFTSSSVTNSYPDADLPAANSVCVVNGYFVFTTGSGLVYASDLNSTAVNALSFGQADSKPDGLVRAIPYASRLLLMGNYSSELWSDEGATPFPFQRQLSIPRGLAGPYAVAGYEDGFGRGIGFVGDDNSVHTLDGSDPVKISPPDLDRLIEAVSDKSTLVASAYISGGHAFWELSSSTWTWVFNFNNQKWHEQASYGDTRSRKIGATYAFGKWLSGDTESGNVLQISGSTYKESGNPFRAVIESGPVRNFPNRIRVARADFDFVTGVGVATGEDPIETDPDIEISWSDDAGYRWSTPLVRKLGRQAKSERVSVFRTGVSGPHGRRWRLAVSSPVYLGLLGGTQSVELRKSV